MSSADDIAELCGIWAIEGIDATVLSPARPIIIQGTFPDGTRFDLRGFGDRVSLRTWPAGARWQRTIVDGDGSTRTIPDVTTATGHAVLDGFAHGEAATLSADELSVAMSTLRESLGA